MLYNIPFLFFLFVGLSVGLPVPIPESFDVRQKYPGCADFILDQHQCGACWAFCSSESFSDRLCITGEAPKGTIVSPQPVLDCSGEGCGGGTPHHAWDYLISNGSSTCTEECTSGCVPFDSSDGSVPACHQGTCDDKTNWPITYYAAYFKYMNGTQYIPEFQKDLMQYGPMGASFDVYENFHSFFDEYPDGIYNQTSGSTTGRHCVKMIGWGTENGLDYWLFSNSWGTDWGVNGTFKMERGVDLCGIEEKISEGYTQKQYQGGVSQFPESIQHRDGEEEEDGGWVVYEKPWTSEFLNSIAKEGLSLFGDRSELSQDFRLLAAKTQVVAGVNFDLKIQVKKEIINLRLYRDPALHLHLSK